jgi:hypothetical protein
LRVHCTHTETTHLHLLPHLYDYRHFNIQFLKSKNVHAQEAKYAKQVQVPQFLQTHPLGSARVDEVRKKLPQAHQAYQQSGCAPRSLFQESRRV